MLEEYWRIIRISKTRDSDSEYGAHYYRVDYREGLFRLRVIEKLNDDEALLRMLSQTPHRRLDWHGLSLSERISLEKRLKGMHGENQRQRV